MAGCSENRSLNDEPLNKKSKTENDILHINKQYTELTFITSLSQAFCSTDKDTKFENEAKIIKDPFTCCVLPNFIQSQSNLDEIKEDIDEIEVECKLNDLYQFKQSQDLSNCSYPGVKALKKLLYEECLEWMREVTKIPLTDKIDISCSCYTYTDHLLCHDDELQGRRIAYIYYLVPEWEEKDGGTLDLFKNEAGQPTEIATSIIPAWNNFVFFEVSPVSYHQVSEILSYKTRTSISGWFHGPPIKRPEPYEETLIFKSPSSNSADIESWINPAYLDPETQEDIRKSFEESSEIELMSFIQEDKYEKVCKVLTDQKLEWRQLGPPSRRKYNELVNIEQDSVIEELENLFCSEEFLLFLSHITGLLFSPTEADDSFKAPDICTSMRRWNHSSYTLLHDQSFTKIPTLHSTLYLNFTKWDPKHGGYTSYVAEEENEELLRVDPKPNSLALVYITEGTSSFVKYINKQSTVEDDSSFYDLFVLYKER